MTTRLKRWAPVLLWMVFIFIASTDLMSAEHTSRFLVPFLRWLKPDISPEALGTIHFFVRKAAHVTEYAILAVLVWHALSTNSPSTWRQPLIVIAIGASYAAADEFHQSFVATRTASAHDVMIDCCGVVTALVICWLCSRRARRKRTWA
jgi:VanZ family protein